MNFLLHLLLAYFYFLPQIPLHYKLFEFYSNAYLYPYHKIFLLLLQFFQYLFFSFFLQALEYNFQQKLVVCLFHLKSNVHILLQYLFFLPFQVIQKDVLYDYALLHLILNLVYEVLNYFFYNFPLLLLIPHY